MAILPNGLLMQIDPGEICKGDVQDSEQIQASLNEIFRRVQALKVFDYFDKDGNWAQDEFFPNPFPGEPPKPRPIVG